MYSFVFQLQIYPFNDVHFVDFIWFHVPFLFTHSYCRPLSHSICWFSMNLFIDYSYIVWRWLNLFVDSSIANNSNIDNDNNKKTLSTPHTTTTFTRTATLYQQFISHETNYIKFQFGRTIIIIYGNNCCEHHREKRALINKNQFKLIFISCRSWVKHNPFFYVFSNVAQPFYEWFIPFNSPLPVASLALFCLIQTLTKKFRKESVNRS